VLTFDAADSARPEGLALCVLDGEIEGFSAGAGAGAGADPPAYARGGVIDAEVGVALGFERRRLVHRIADRLEHGICVLGHQGA